MLMSIPYNKYDDGTGRLANELFCMNNEFEKCLALTDISSMAKKLSNIFNELLEIQFSLNEEKSKMSARDVAEYQKSLDNAFKYVRILDKKLTNARKMVINLAKNGDITSSNDSICFSHDDLLNN